MVFLYLWGRIHLLPLEMVLFSEWSNGTIQVFNLLGLSLIINYKINYRAVLKKQMAHLMHLTLLVRVSLYIPWIYTFYHSYKKCLLLAIKNELWRLDPSILLSGVSLLCHVKDQSFLPKNVPLKNLVLVCTQQILKILGCLPLSSHFITIKFL